MTDERNLVPVKSEYLFVLGQCLYCFARLEWDAAWCLEKLRAGFIAERDLRKITAGTLANRLLAASLALSDQTVFRYNLLASAERFKELVDTRNKIFHGTPHTDAEGEQRLGAHGQTWTPQKIETASDLFTQCSLQLNALLHEHLISR